ncbi:FAD-dependent oxidoreductase [Paenibacillus dakarensis]|uniref:FAD-dependent oxidoreductase n=1 Tax=Paenibacillus dakarensis TaxID=1527293 RepID=UPI0006D580FA|nr:FAD-dependent oxidoreductase [Paenibacillus dakarensis]
MEHRSADIVIIGGGLGGSSAALAAAKSGKRVILTEETDWLGGQITSQIVPPDEHPWIEKFGSTASYREYRDRVRNYYKDNFPVTPESRNARYFNPGSAMVSAIAHEPRAALAVLRDMMAPYIHSGKLIVMTEHVPVQAETDGDDITAVHVLNKNTGETLILTGAYIIDATEEGDLLPLAGVEYVTGSESIKETGEPHALPGDADPQDMQAFTWCFVMDYCEGEDHTIEKPETYDFWREYQADFWPDKQLSWAGLVPHTLEPVTYSLFPDGKSFSLWKYRQLVDRENFVEGTFDTNVTVVNWPANDYWLGSIIDVPEEERKLHLERSKELSRSLMYWMQTEAPRPDGGKGYPGLRLRPDIAGTPDGFAKMPYIRESRRIKAEFTVLEQHVAAASRPDGKAEDFFDSVGVGCYRIDLHPSTALRTYVDFSALPFEIPLGSLIPIRVNNLIAACKNIGTTHITNGCYRLHPVEWNIGESAGYLAAYCVEHGVKPRDVRNTPEHLEALQRNLVNAGVELKWPVIHEV